MVVTVEALVKVCKGCQFKRSVENCTVKTRPVLHRVWNRKLPLGRLTGWPMKLGGVFVSRMFTTEVRLSPSHAPPEAEMSSRENCRAGSMTRSLMMGMVMLLLVTPEAKVTMPEADT